MPPMNPVVQPAVSAQPLDLSYPKAIQIPEQSLNSVTYVIRSDRLDELIPIDPSEVNQFAKFVFYCGNELMNAHPSLQALSMLGRAFCGFITIAEHSLDGSLHRSSSSLSISSEQWEVSSEVIQMMIPETLDEDKGLNNALSESSDSLTSKLTASSNISTASSAGRELLPESQRSLAKEEDGLGKKMVVFGETLAATGYILTLLTHGAPLSTVLLDGGFSVMTINCFKVAQQAHQQVKQINEQIKHYSSKDLPEPRKALILDFLKSERESNYLSAVCMAGYGLAFTVSFLAPITSLGLFTPFVIAEYYGKYQYSESHQAQVTDENPGFEAMPEQDLVELYHYFQRDKESFRQALQDQAKPRPFLVIEALVAHKLNQQELIAHFKKVDQQQDASTSKTIAPMNPARAQFIQELMPMASLAQGSIDYLQTALKDQALDYQSELCLKLVEDYFAEINHDAHLPNLEPPVVDEKPFAHEDLTQALNFLGMDVDPKAIKVGQYYDFAFESFKQVAKQSQDFQIQLIKEIKKRINSELI